MKCEATKKCDMCKQTVARKSLLWHTAKDYVTIQGNEVPGYADMEYNTKRANWHFCYHCFAGIMKAAGERMKDNANL